MYSIYVYDTYMYIFNIFKTFYDTDYIFRARGMFVGI